jgi:hypothetical protein
MVYNMCLLIVAPDGNRVSRRHLKEAFRINSDGAGFMFDLPSSQNKSGQDVVKIFKGWFGFRQFYKDLRTCERAFPTSTFVIHMRIGTSGSKTADNCHPFRVSHDAGFAHNGVMFGLGDNKRSDTREFVEDALCKLPSKFWENKDIMAALDQCATASSSKYVLLLGDGSYFILNEDMGHWYNGCWYSNKSYTLPTTKADEIVPKPVIHAPIHFAAGASVPCPELPGEEETHCNICASLLTPQTMGFHRWSLKLCNSCLEGMYDVVHIRCEACLMNNRLTRQLLSGRHDACEFCGATISQDDVAWQLITSIAR